jgi:hypothetical protein
MIPRRTAETSQTLAGAIGNAGERVRRVEVVADEIRDGPQPRPPRPSVIPTARANPNRLRVGLQSPAALRNAMLLSEILGPPVCLRSNDLPGERHE